MIVYMVGKLAPNSNHFTRGLVKYVPRRGCFRAVPSRNENKFATSPTPLVVERFIDNYMNFIPPDWYDIRFRINKLLVAPFWRKGIETKSGQNSIFESGGSQGRLRACPFLGTWRALLCGGVMRVGAAGDNMQRFLENRWFEIQKPSEVVRAKYLRRTYSGQSLVLYS